MHGSARGCRQRCADTAARTQAYFLSSAATRRNTSLNTLEAAKTKPLPASTRISLPKMLPANRRDCFHLQGCSNTTAAPAAAAAANQGSGRLRISDCSNGSPTCKAKCAGCLRQRECNTAPNKLPTLSNTLATACPTPPRASWRARGAEMTAPFSASATPTLNDSVC